jgi:hypothetical protein
METQPLQRKQPMASFVDFMFSILTLAAHDHHLPRPAGRISLSVFECLDVRFFHEAALVKQNQQEN